MTAYVIFEGEVFDAEAYEAYKAAAAPTVAAVGGRYLVRGGRVDALEGEVPTGRTVVVELPSREVALEWYASDAYGRARELRLGCAEVNMYLVDGVG